MYVYMHVCTNIHMSRVHMFGRNGLNQLRHPVTVTVTVTVTNGTLRFAMRRLRAVTCGPGRQSTSVMLGHACEMLARMYLQ